MFPRFVLLALPLTLAGCAGARVSDWPVKIGRPYSVRGVTYVPAAAPGYEAVGYASWYGSESGNRTANGERYRARWVSGAHTTLPLPSYVEVTALTTGRTILVRVNDRGPFSSTRVIDLSRGAARVLGVEQAGRVAVHVRLVDPPERDRARLRRGKPAVARRNASPGKLAAWRSVLAAQ
ncbi:septal ring lytic transglycosylase RlpA family protein [uncultured Sphingomonas sp.]|uniref:septal ring lytic transglycosylase RlpA family protein n=1 Tax=uncultured Sphingomonas sp. TaxID=158754 RepID=UPI0025D6ED97|nr:septal ring lytic transglycosylase RlpA family protein [uncultured Sphingomonas sp.]